MSGALNEQEFDALLADALAPAERPADRGFVARVDLAVAEADRYRCVRSAARRQLVSDALAAAALCGSFLTIAQAPQVREALAGTSGLLWPALLALLLFWMLVRGRGALA